MSLVLRGCEIYVYLTQGGEVAARKLICLLACLGEPGSEHLLDCLHGEEEAIGGVEDWNEAVLPVKGGRAFAFGIDENACGSKVGALAQRAMQGVEEENLTKTLTLTRAGDGETT